MSYFNVFKNLVLYELCLISIKGTGMNTVLIWDEEQYDNTILLQRVSQGCGIDVWKGTF